MDEITVGLIGYGLAGSVFHAPLVNAEARMRLASVVTSRKDQVTNDLPGVQVVETADELFADPNIELVVVASPNTTHVPFARAALVAGKHVVIDKPFAPTLGEADALIALAEEKDRFLSIFHNRRWDDGFLTARHCIEQGLVGTVAHYEVHFDRFRPAIKQGWREQPLKGSGLLYDLGPHLIDQSLVLFGLPKAVTADVITQRPQAVMDDYFHVILDYGRMRAILHAATLVRRPGPHVILHGDAGSFSKHGLDPQEAALKAGWRPGMPGWGETIHQGILTRVDGTETMIDTLPGRYEAYYAAVAASIRDGAPPPVTGREARDVMLVLETALRSAVERRTVAVI
ncbi:oxidoreductase [Stutzerimonas stutzeri]|uniref:oxidoreductase n=1 Tax=Stutzerimonas stutzeri TaxID=316 RepID=UPI00210ECB54|nr:oxidoreductase [Stutzerimonas stutzeri]MCQ4323055.1 oxidoreductase [Stutzerimonas stutzeri]